MNFPSSNTLEPLQLSCLDSMNRNRKRSVTFSFDSTHTYSDSMLPSLLRPSIDSPESSLDPNSTSSLILPSVANSDINNSIRSHGSSLAEQYDTRRRSSSSFSGRSCRERNSEKEDPYPKLNSLERKHMIKQQSKEIAHFNDDNIDFSDDEYMNVEIDKIPKLKSRKNSKGLFNPIIASPSLNENPYTRLQKGIVSPSSSKSRSRTNSTDSSPMKKKLFTSYTKTNPNTNVSPIKPSMTIQKQNSYRLHITYLSTTYHIVFNGNSIQELNQQILSTISLLLPVNVLFEHPSMPGRYEPLLSMDQLYDNMEIKLVLDSNRI